MNVHIEKGHERRREKTARPAGLRSQHFTRYLVTVRVCLNASNIKHGGAIGVAASFMDEVLKKFARGELDWMDDLTLQVSTTVQKEMHFGSMNVDDSRIRLEVVPAEIRPLVPSFTRQFDVRFSIFGPEYAARKARVEIAGFADGSLFPPPDFRPPTGSIRSAEFGLVRLIKLSQLSRYNGLIVETPVMANKLRERLPRTPIWVVPNSPRDIFFETELPAPKIFPPRKDGELRLFYPARGYPHKNHKIIPQLADQYWQLSGSQLRVVTTLRPDEMKSLGLSRTESLINVGEIGSDECARLMHACDGVLFPSLNETSSVTPLESIAAQRILFAADRAYVRDALGEGAVYFDPLDAADGARRILEFQNGNERIKFVANNKHRRTSLTSQSQRADAYLEVIKNFHS